MDRLLEQVRALLADADFRWAIGGGYALELFAGRTLRPHGDVDVCILEPDREAAIAFLLEKGWRVLEFHGMGKVKPIHAPADSEPGRNLMPLLGDCPLVEFFPCEEEGLLYHQFRHTGMTTLSYLDLLFSPVDGDQLLFGGRSDVSRALPEAILPREGLPILAPEIALLHKASSPDDPRAQADLAAVYPLLDASQKRWFQAGLAAVYPQGHPWSQA